jgi:hypothetical protein
MVQKHILISLIAPVAITGILILAAISSADQAFAYSSYHKTYYKGHHAYYKNSEYTKRHGNIPTSNTGNQAQGASNVNTAQGASNVNTAQGASNVNTAQGASNTGNTAQGASNVNTAQGASNTGNTAQGASNVNTAKGASNGKLEVDNIAGLPNLAKSFPNPGPLLGKMTDNQLWGLDFGILK